MHHCISHTAHKHTWTTHSTDTPGLSSHPCDNASLYQPHSTQTPGHHIAQTHLDCHHIRVTMHHCISHTAHRHTWTTHSTDTPGLSPHLCDNASLHQPHKTTTPGMSQLCQSHNNIRTVFTSMRQCIIVSAIQDNHTWNVVTLYRCVNHPCCINDKHNCTLLHHTFTTPAL